MNEPPVYVLSCGHTTSPGEDGYISEACPICGEISEVVHQMDAQHEYATIQMSVSTVDIFKAAASAILEIPFDEVTNDELSEVLLRLSAERYNNGERWYFIEESMDDESNELEVDAVEGDNDSTVVYMKGRSDGRD
jgi:hypothetical protein